MERILTFSDSKLESLKTWVTYNDETKRNAKRRNTGTTGRLAMDAGLADPEVRRHIISKDVCFYI